MSKPAINVVNKFLFQHPDVIAVLGNTSFSDGEIYPISEQPETVEPYIIYNWRSRASNNQWWMNYEDITYGVFSTSVGTMQEIERAIINVLRRHESSAREINDYAKSIGESDVTIKYVRYNGSVNADSQSQEGGVFGKTLFFEVLYTETSDSGAIDIE